MGRDFAVEGASQSNNNRTTIGKQNVQYGPFYGRVKAADDNLIRCGHLFGPLLGQGECLGWSCTGCKKCHQVSIQQGFVTGQVHKKSADYCIYLSHSKALAAQFLNKQHRQPTPEYISHTSSQSRWWGYSPSWTSDCAIFKNF